MITIRVLIIAENLLARAGLGALLDEMDAIEVVGQTTNDMLAYQVDYQQPDVLLVDLGWRIDTQETALTTILEQQLPIVALVSDDTQAADALTELSTTDCYAVLLRDSEAERIQAAIHGVYAGLITFDSALAQLVIQPSEATIPTSIEALTPREDEVLQLLAKGLTNKAIAHELSITDHTVKFHVNAIMGKLGAQSRTEAVVKATQAGLIIL